MKKLVFPSDLPQWRVVREKREVTSFHSEAEARAALADPFIDASKTETTWVTTLEQWQEASPESKLPGVWMTVEEKK